MVADTPPIWVPPSPAIIRPATADLLLTPAYWPTDPRQRVLAFRDLRDAGRFSPDQIREAAAIWKVKGALVIFAPVFFMAGSAPRGFTISPAVSGKTTWDLDVDGPLTLTTAGTWTVTPLPGFAATVELNGGGGGSGNGNSTGASGGTGGSSSFAGMTANGGAGSATPTTNTPSAGGAGGTASGGTTNTTGSAGGAGFISPSSGVNTEAGDGGASPNGGATQPGGVSLNGYISGVTGNSPGGGASGGGLGRTNTSSLRRSAGGGGGGGYLSRSYAVGGLAGAQTLVVGAGGTALTTGNGPGAVGAAGRAIIT